MRIKASRPSAARARDSRRGAALGSTLVAAVVTSGVLLAAPPARAQSLRPNILFIFDTSGSMREDAGGTNRGEGTNICTAGNTSRLYNLKSALRAALAQAGTDEANFGLMSFPTSVTNTFQNQTCSVGHYRTSATQTVTTPNRVMTGNHSATGFQTGCLMTTNLNNETTYGPWFDMGASEVLRVGVTTAAPGATPTAANYDPSDANIPAIYRWIDNIELPTTNGAVTDPELHGDGYTPLGRSLLYARAYYDGVVKPHDPRATCRQNVVVLITDGAETCDEATAPDNNFSLTTCTGGAAYDAFHPVSQACTLFRTSGIKTYMITDSGLSNNDLAAADRIAAAGGTTSAIRVSLADANAAKAAIIGIIAATVPPAEVCNGVDDNCNGQIDEGVSNMCPFDATTLKHCAVETANCLDDNCNGQIDEGFPPNICGKGAGCPIPPEICDGIDNDCDGDIDEGFDAGAACDNGQTGTCRRRGIKECTPDGSGTTCVLVDTPTGTEICNGIDDDCNGMIDDGLGPGQGIGIECGSQAGICQRGVTKCVGGKIVCDTVSMPQPETCNGVDDDCNGIIDDGVFPGVGDTCICPGLDPAKVGVGVCKAGRKVCRGTAGIVCEGCVLPGDEICDGKDNDCDGNADTTAMCPTGFGCKDGSCSLLCRAGEFPCPPGYDCTNGYCVPNRCRNVTCPTDQKCDNDTGTCVDLCYKVTCQTDQTCLRGQCLDCSNSDLLKCPTGQLCINRKCVSDQCAGVNCAVGEYCSFGRCVGLTCSPPCGPNERCISGECRPFNCDQIACSGTEYCDPATGTCKPDMCVAKTCGACAKATGECIVDPCTNINCPNDGCWECLLTPDGEPYCNVLRDCSYVKTVAGNSGGGCSCSTAETSPSGLVTVLTLFGLIFALRRRRAR